jgi:hypothetical protein
MAMLLPHTKQQLRRIIFGNQWSLELGYKLWAIDRNLQIRTNAL